MIYVVVLYSADADPDGIDPAPVSSVHGPFRTTEEADQFGSMQASGDDPREWDRFPLGSIGGLDEVTGDARPDLVSRARALYQGDDIEIDEDAVVSESDYGDWVQAWVFVGDSDLM